MREQINGRFTPGTRERIQRLARPGETLADTLERALDALEASPAADPLEQRIERLERLLAADSEPLGRDSKTAPKRASKVIATDSDGTVPRGTRPYDARTRYPAEAKRAALDLLDSGASHREIADALSERFGLRPSAKNLSRHLKRWREDLTDTAAL